MFTSIQRPKCRHCDAELRITLADLGSTPISNEYLPPERVDGPEASYPLRALVCSNCRLVQLQNFFRPDDLFREDYAYFSSYSSAWLAHAEQYARTMIDRFGLVSSSKVVEVASNDGYLLQYFAGCGIDVLGIEPSKSVADVAMRERNIPTLVKFFGKATAEELVINGVSADLIAANNVLAHVPDINDFVAGFRVLLAPEGVVTFEFPHLLNLIQLNQFDTIYHEHFSYLSLLALEKIFAKAELRVFDVEQLTTHGGSLRLFVCHVGAKHAVSERVAAVRTAEAKADLDKDDVYIAFSEKVRETKRALLSLLIKIKRENKSIAAYGAPAKGNTLLNYCGIGRDFIDYTVDRSPFKQGRFLPGTRLPIHSPSRIQETKPDFILILPWNLKDEILADHAYVRNWGARFILPIPYAHIVD